MYLEQDGHNVTHIDTIACDAFIVPLRVAVLALPTQSGAAPITTHSAYG